MGRGAYRRSRPHPDRVRPGLTTRIDRLQRILDIDLDFFLTGTAYDRPRDAGRLSAADYPPWSPTEVLAFLENKCGLSDPLPGFVEEHHGEFFARWRSAIDSGTLVPPFSVTHLDAHADLGLGGTSWDYLLSVVMFMDPRDRRSPHEGQGALDDGSWLSFAIACRWVTDLTYVSNGSEDHPSDIHPYVMEDGDTRAANIELAAVHEWDTQGVGEPGWRNTVVQHFDPKVPLTTFSWRSFTAPAPFDYVCLARSPSYTPPESDALFDLIRDQFIDEDAWEA